MKISDLAGGVDAAEKPSLCHLIHPVELTPLYADPKERKLPIQVHVLSYDSREIKKLERDQQQRMLSRKGVRSGKITLSAEELEANAVEVLVAAIRMVENLEASEGIPVDPTSPDTVRTMLETPWIREQISDHMADRANYLGN